MRDVVDKLARWWTDDKSVRAGDRGRYLPIGPAPARRVHARRSGRRGRGQRVGRLRRGRGLRAGRTGPRRRAAGAAALRGLRRRRVRRGADLRGHHRPLRREGGPGDVSAARRGRRGDREGAAGRGGHGRLRPAPTARHPADRLAGPGRRQHRLRAPGRRGARRRARPARRGPQRRRCTTASTGSAAARDSTSSWSRSPRLRG